MRKLTFIMIMLFCASFTYAQKGKVSQASSYLSSGKLDEAKKLIDEAALLTPADLQEVARKYLRADNLREATLLP